jgi:hypothetical protein
MPKSSHLRQLCPMMVDDLHCVGGRLQNTGPDIAKHPVILPQQVGSMLESSLRQTWVDIGE